MWLNVILFFGSLGLVLWASELLAKGIARVGSKLHVSEALLGILTAVGADSPEIASAITAIVSRKTDLGIGIVLGSNLFNLAALLGMGAVVAGSVSARSAGTIFHGSVALAVTIAGGGLITGVFSPAIAMVLVAIIVIPYVYIASARANRLETLPLPASRKQFLIHAATDAKQEARDLKHEARDDELRKPDNHSKSEDSWIPALWILPALAVIVVCSFGLIQFATTIGQGWLPQAVLGTFVLASLTGLPNAVSAIHLARRRRGAAVITETFNSNTINIVVGLLFPALAFGTGPSRPLVFVDLGCLFFMTALSTVLTAASARLTRNQGFILIGTYLCFVLTWAFVFTRQ